MKDRYLFADQDYDLWVLLAHTRHLIFKLRRRELSIFGISARKSAVLYIIEPLGDKATPAEIACWLLRELNSVSEVLGRMEKDGLITRVREPKRKNVVKVLFTDKGRELYNRAKANDPISCVMRALSEDERQQLRTSLHLLHQTVLRTLRSKVRKGLN